MMKLIKGVVLGALVALPVLGMAQGSETNVVWKNSLGLGATYRDGNTEKVIFVGTVKADRTSEKTDWINSLYGEYGKTEGEQTEGQIRMQSEFRYKFSSEDWYAGVFTEGYHDDIRDLSYRVKIGPNIGYYWINKETMKLDTSFGVNGVAERNGGKDSQYGEYRLAAAYNWDFTESATVYSSVEYTMQMDDTEEGSGLLIAGLRNKINNQFSMTIEFRDDYDNKPAKSDIDNNDITVIAGLTYDF